MADSTGRPAAKKTADQQPQAPRHGVSTDDVDPEPTEPQNAPETDAQDERDDAQDERDEVVSSPAQPEAPFLTEGSRIELEETGHARDPFTGRDLTREDLP